MVYSEPVVNINELDKMKDFAWVRPRPWRFAAEKRSPVAAKTAIGISFGADSGGAQQVVLRDITRRGPHALLRPSVRHIATARVRAGTVTV